MKVFITVTYKREENKEDVEHLCSLVRLSGFIDFCFVRDVEHYKNTFSSSSELMKSAKREILKSDILLIDMTHKPTGRAIEAGIAFASGKKIITIIKKGVVIKDTVRGISDLIIEYSNIEDIVEPLTAYRVSLDKSS